MLFAIKLIMVLLLWGLQLWIALLTLQYGLGIVVIDWYWLGGGLIGIAIVGAIAAVLMHD